jgi:arginine:pyruvate transaminase
MSASRARNRESGERRPVHLASWASEFARRERSPWRIHTLATERIERGEEIIVLSIGEPDFPTPDFIVEATVASLRQGRTGYAPPRGLESLREAIASATTEQIGSRIAPQRVTFFPGAQCALFATMLSIVEAGDEVIVFEPAYATYHGVLAAARATPVFLPLSSEKRFHPDIEDFQNAFTENTRAVILNTPHNPTGAVLSGEEIHSIAATCRTHGVWLVSDEVYASLTYGPPHVSALSAEGANEFVVALGSLSKSHAMTGFRHGWAIGPESLSEQLARLTEAMLFGCPPFVQDAGLAAIASGSAVVKEMRESYWLRGKSLLEELAGAPGVAASAPEGGMFVLADVRESGVTSEVFALRLLEEEHVAVTPTDGFGQSAAGHIRISLGADDGAIREAGGRICALAIRLAEEVGAD